MFLLAYLFIFASTVSHAIIPPFSFLTAAPFQVHYLIVGNGGNGAGTFSGGGGGGDVKEGFITIPRGTYPAVVGQQTLGVPQGSSSSWNGFTAVGGGQGGPEFNDGLPGGSGGGAGGDNVTSRSGGSASGSNAFAGGSNFVDGQAPGGGGGGGGGVGGNASKPVLATGGNGGIGYLSAHLTALYGSNKYYAGGGGGGVGIGTNGTGGLGGGGDGSAGAVAGTDGAANSGGGGGGGGNPGAFGNGGSGVIVIDYPGSAIATGCTVTSVGGNTVHTCTASSTNFVY